MVEPTETETQETLDAFAEAIAEILREAARGPRDRARRALHDAGAPPRRGRRGQAPGAPPGAAVRRAAQPLAPMRIFSGIQPTGRKHLGNYIGAITQYVAGQERGEAHLLHRRPARDHRRLRARRAARAHSTTRPRSCSPRARPGALHPVPPERRARAHRADLAAVRASPSSGACSACTSSATSRPRSASWSPRGCSSTRCCRPPTCSPTAPTRCRSARTSASTSS